MTRSCGVALAGTLMWLAACGGAPEPDQNEATAVHKRVHGVYAGGESPN